MQVISVKIKDLKPSEYNPRAMSEKEEQDLKTSLDRFGFVEPLVVNSAPERENVVIGGHQRLKIAEKMGMTEVPVFYVLISDLGKEKELNLRLNKNLGHWDYDLLAQFDECLLKEIGFDSPELDNIFNLTDLGPEKFDLQAELEKLKITEIKTQKGDIYQLGDHRLMCGDSTIEADFAKMMGDEKADMCFTDPPYILDYLKTKFKGKGAGFGYKQNRKYLETDEIPADFTEKWMANIAKAQKENFHIIVYENWKNLRVIWAEMEKHWKVKNMIVWHCNNRNQGFSAKYRFFSKHDIAMVGTTNDDGLQLNQAEEEKDLQEQYETALYAISGKPHWEGYQKGGMYCPTDFIEYKASDSASSGQGVIFGTKPTEILIPYIKVLTQRGDLIVEPFGGSGSTLMASEIMKRRCFTMEKVPTYCEVIKARWEKFTGKKAEKING